MVYTTELHGQTNFYQTYLPRVNKDLTIDEIQNNYTDGIVNGNLLEFKLQISDLNSVLFQAIKYLSVLRIKGIRVPKNIILISLNTDEAYIYNSEDYLKNIEKVYNGAKSKGNSGFVCGKCNHKLDLKNDIGQETLISHLKSSEYTKIHLDENCIVGWATTYYKENPLAKKSDFLGDETGQVKIIGEIRKPKVFADYIYPYKNKDNEKFRYLMDKLNDQLLKKNLGAFYTHKLYSKKSIELLRKAINMVPQGNDYIILDRCAGTGNLELFLTDEELSHTIVSTLEYYEYKVLLQTIGDKVRHIIPPTEKEDTFNMGLVKGADALSEEYINSSIVQKYIKNKNCTIILFENPPYSETTSLEHQKTKNAKNSSVWKSSLVAREMKKEITGSSLNDLGNAFIWSAFKYYLRQPTDCYIVFSPVKYWKAQNLIRKRFIKGFAFNRKHFHTNIDACIMCALWSNENCDINSFEIEGYDIINDKLSEPITLKIEKVHRKFSEAYYSHTPFKSSTEDGILIGLNGLEAEDSVKRRIKPIYSDEMIGYLVADSFGFDNPDAKSSLLVAGRYNGNGTFLHKSNFLEKLPMFAASRYITYNREWTERARIMKSGDGANNFNRDVKNGTLQQFLLKCLLFVVLEPQNHMRTFLGSDSRLYVNKLCFDNTNGETIASCEIKNLKQSESEKEMMLQWNKILTDAKATSNYQSQLTYGLYQIKTELNTIHKDEETGETIYDYPSLNGNIKGTSTELCHSI